MAQVWGSQRGFRWKNNTVTQLYTQGHQGHSKEETVPKKVKVEQRVQESLQESCQNQEEEQKGGKAKGNWCLKTGNVVTNGLSQGVKEEEG